jgi:hypothetical protein
MLEQMKRIPQIIIPSIFAAVFLFFSNCANAQSRSAIEECISGDIQEGRLELRRVQVHRDGRVVGIRWALGCSGDLARQVWVSLFPMRSTDPWRWRDAQNNENESFHFGTNSLCSRRLINSDGSPANSFWCHIYLDLNDIVLRSIR